MPTLQKLWADGNYTGPLGDYLRASCGVELEVVAKPTDQRGFVPIPKRWVVERTFAWFGRFRRLARDYETHAAVSEAFLSLAMIRILTRRLAKVQLTS